MLEEYLEFGAQLTVRVKWKDYPRWTQSFEPGDQEIEVTIQKQTEKGADFRWSGFWTFLDNG